ncbi:histidine kinase [Microbacterium sp. KUDC0406]|uniref:sensor histidine kinase n=1 Tax=Microbacterium sp. KUDC0406 TaxID=2909588 RepID=UPI001F2A9D3A|nr:histidine kinase [Microbacterium sp. KUDC0406]UJP09865.1 histidine kinase [Microbacterium sp. KUDC0406]
MPEPADPDAAEPELQASPRLPGPRGAGRLISLVGIAFTAYALSADAASAAPWAIVVGIAALAAWLALTALPPATPLWPRLVLLAVMIVAGGVTSAATASIASAVLVVGIVTVLGSTAVPLSLGFVFTASGLLTIAICALTAPPVLQVLVSIAGVAAGVLIGLARRQTRLATDRERRTAQELVEANRALAASAVRDERARIARDLHDVLAHTLGGLVVQLDAVEALAEAGRVDQAAARAHSARELAADGLRDARIAVGVLDGTRALDLADLADQVRHLVATEQRLGASVAADIADLHGTATPALVQAFGEAARESLTNARKHAPAASVRLRLGPDGGMLVLDVANDLAGPHSALAGSGSHRGLDGIRERFSALPGGEVRISDSAGAFRLRAEAKVS